MNYNYMEAIKDDIRNYIDDSSIKVTEDNRDEVEEMLNDDLWICDSVTGNASGSYTFSRSEARKNLEGNSDLVRDMCQDFCLDAKTIAEKFLDEDYEYFDVSVRCYLLGQAIGMVLDEIIEEEDAEGQIV